MKTRIITGLLALIGVSSLVFAPITAYAADENTCVGAQCAQVGADKVKTGGAKTSNLSTAIKTVVNTLLFVIGVIAVIMIVIGGLKYTTSNGDSNQVTSAKNTILYAVIGLIVAIMAYALVNFVIKSFV